CFATRGSLERQTQQTGWLLPRPVYGRYSCCVQRLLPHSRNRQKQSRPQIQTGRRASAQRAGRRRHGPWHGEHALLWRRWHDATSGWGVELYKVLGQGRFGRADVEGGPAAADQVGVDRQMDRGFVDRRSALDPGHDPATVAALELPLK